MSTLPPANKPLPEEVDRCLAHLVDEVAALPKLAMVIAPGKIAWDAWLKLLIRQGVKLPRPRPTFSYGAIARFGPLGTPGTPGTLIGMYHPSRQNTNTGTVTPAMYDAVLRRVRAGVTAARGVSD